MYTLLLITTQTFLGQYNSIESCNQAIRSIIERQLIPYPDAIPHKQFVEMQKAVDLQLKYQRTYVCIKSN